MSTYVNCLVSIDEVFPDRRAIALAKEMVAADFVRFPASILVGGPRPQDFHPPSGLTRDHDGYRTVYRTPSIYYFREIASYCGRKFDDAIGRGSDLETLTNIYRSDLPKDAQLLSSYREYATSSFLSALGKLKLEGTIIIEFSSLNPGNQDIQSMLKRQDASMPDVFIGSSDRVLEYSYVDGKETRKVRPLTEFVRLWGNNGPMTVEDSALYKLIQKHFGEKLSHSVGFS